MYDEHLVLEYADRIKKKIASERFYPRELEISPIKNKCVSIIGPRRAGKTTLLLNYMKTRNKVVYLDLEHLAFRNITGEEIFRIIPLLNSDADLILIDEIQVLERWERVVRSLLDSGFGVIISGSSSKLTNREVAAQLRGRSTTKLLLPLSFREYLSFLNVDYSDRGLSLTKIAEIKKNLQKFLIFGGYPEVILNENKAEEILKTYYETVFFKDFVERFQLKSIKVAEFIFEFVLQNFSKEISINKIVQFVNSKLISNTKDTVYEYIDKLDETLNVFFLERMKETVYERKSWPKKIYIADTGMTQVVRFSKDLGKLMENAVYLDLLRRTNEKPFMKLYYWKDYQQREVDFVIKEGTNVKQLIQVNYASAKDEIEKREIRSLLKASEELKCKDLLVITWDYEDEEKMNRKKIRYVPLWKWLLHNKPAPV